MAESGASIKLGVTGVAQFKQNINAAKQSLKTLEEQLSLNEKQFKSTGDQEEYLAKQSETLKTKLDEQKAVADLAQKALDEMSRNGVDKASRSFQEMQRTLLQAQGGMLDTQAALDALGTESQDTGKQAEELDQKLNGIGKGVTFENVTNGIHAITEGLERGARAAVNLGKKILESAKGSTGFADEVKTVVAQYRDMGLTADSYQRMKKVEDLVDTPVEAILSARQKMNKALTTSNGQRSIDEVLGVHIEGQSPEDIFWNAGEALLAMGEGFDKEAAAQSLFGRSWRELVPLFEKGRKGYEELMGSQTVLTDEQIDKLGEADDAIVQFETKVEELKNQFWAENADKLTAALQWIIDNKDGLVTALEVLAGAFGALKIAEFALNVGKAVSGLKELKLLSGGEKAAEAGGSVLSSTGAKIGLSGAAGLAGLGLIAYTSAWAADRRRNHREAVLGTEENFAARNAGKGDVTAALYRYLEAEKALNEQNTDEAAKVYEEAEAAFHGMEGWEATWRSYQDWLSEGQGRQMYDIPESMQKMEEAADELSGGGAAQKQSSSELLTAANGMKGLPGVIEGAIRNGMSGIHIYIDGQQAGRALTPYVGAGLGSGVLAMTK